MRDRPPRSPSGPTSEFVETLVRTFVDQGRPATALGEAARYGRLDLVEELLATGLDVDARNESGATPLMLAASGGQPKVVEALIRRGADPNAPGGPQNATPLIFCLAALHPKRVYLAVCRMLLDAGASCDVRGADGRSPLDWAKLGRPDEVVALIEECVRA